MTHRVRLRPEAEEDIEQAASWYQRQREGLAYEFIDAVEAALNAIKEKPEAYPKVYKTARRALIQKFPFGIHYLIEQDQVVVFAVMHASRDPKRWKSRT